METEIFKIWIDNEVVYIQANKGAVLQINN